MKTILHLIETSGPGGAEKVLISLAERLDKNQYSSIVCLLKDGWLNAQLQKRGFETVLMPQQQRTLDVYWLASLMRLIKEKHISLMHAHEFAMNTYGSIISAFTGIPIVTTVHGKGYCQDKWRRRAAYRFVSRHSRMVAVSEDIKKFLIDRIGINQKRVRAIRNGIDLSLFSAKDGIRGVIRNELHITNGQPIIGTIGNLYPVKGHTYLLKGIAIVKRAFPEVKLLIAGRGRLLPDLQKECTDLDIEKNVVFLGFREDVPALLQAVDIFALPSLSEGLSISLLEAMATGKPVIATNVGGNPEIVIDGQTGFLIPARNPEALAERVLFLVENEMVARRMGISGRMRVENEFALETMVERYQQLYAQGILPVKCREI